MTKLNKKISVNDRKNWNKYIPASDQARRSIMGLQFEFLIIRVTSFWHNFRHFILHFLSQLTFQLKIAIIFCIKYFDKNQPTMRMHVLTAQPVVMMTDMRSLFLQGHCVQQILSKYWKVAYAPLSLHASTQMKWLHLVIILTANIQQYWGNYGR